MSTPPTIRIVPSSPAPARGAWTQVVIAAVVMLATLPGRTQGLGLITEPMLADLHLDRVLYATINLWATLIGAAFCVPAGWLLDRCGLRGSTTILVLLLGAVVCAMSVHADGVAMLFLLIMLTRGLGQSALSVASITAVGQHAIRRPGVAMGVYAAIFCVLFALAFTVVGAVVSGSGWRTAWLQIGLVLLLGIAPLVLVTLRSPPVAPSTAAAVDADGFTLFEALRTGSFWVFAGATALYGLVSSGLGLFNEAVLAERGFDQGTYHAFLAITTLIALLGQLLCGWLTLRWSLPRLLGVAMFLYALALAALPVIAGAAQLWAVAAVMGLSGGFVTVVFFAVWSHAFGRRQLGRIQGAAQMLTVLASASGPLLFASCHRWSGSYAVALWTLAPLVLLLGVVAMRLAPPVRRVRPAAALLAQGA